MKHLGISQMPLTLPSKKWSNFVQCPVFKMGKLKHDIRLTPFAVLMFASNMNFVVNRKVLSKVSAELCKHVKNQKWKNIQNGRISLFMHVSM